MLGVLHKNQGGVITPLGGLDKSLVLERVLSHGSKEGGYDVGGSVRGGVWSDTRNRVPAVCSSRAKFHVYPNSNNLWTVSRPPLAATTVPVVSFYVHLNALLYGCLTVTATSKSLLALALYSCDASQMHYVGSLKITHIHIS